MDGWVSGLVGVWVVWSVHGCMGLRVVGSFDGCVVGSVSGWLVFDNYWMGGFVG